MKLTDRDALPVVVVIMIFLVALVGFIPQMITDTQGNETKTVQLEENQTADLKPPLSTTLEEFNGNNLSVLISHETNGKTVSSGIINESETTNVTLDSNTNITVTYVENIAGFSAYIEYEYPTFLGHDGPSVEAIQIIALLLIAIFLYLIYVVINMGGNE